MYHMWEWLDVFVLIYSLLTVVVTDTASIYNYLITCILYIYIYIYIYIIIDNLAVHITVIISVVLWPLVFNTKGRFMFLLTFEMFTFVVSRTMCSILFFSVNRGKPAFWIFDGGTLKRGTKLVSNYNTDVKGS